MQIKAENLNYVYSPKTPFEKTALDNVSFTVNEGDTLGIVGATGSGKSTLTRHLNALIRIQSGKIFLGDVDLSAKRVDLKEVRKKVGMLFQFPEYQLFADTVKKDVEFGPKNFGFGDKEAACAAEDALRSVGLDIKEIGDKSPFELSGGQMRRVAIAVQQTGEHLLLLIQIIQHGVHDVPPKHALEVLFGFVWFYFIRLYNVFQ